MTDTTPPVRTYSYDDTLPTPRDRVRAALGDTGPEEWLRSNEFYDALLGSMSEPRAMAAAARSLASEFARQPSSASIPGGPSVTFGDRVKALQDVAKAADTAAAQTENGSASAPAFVDQVLVRPGMEPGQRGTEYTDPWRSGLRQRVY